MKAETMFTSLLLAVGIMATAQGAEPSSNNNNYNSVLIESIYQEVSTLWETEGLEGLSTAVGIDSLSPAYRPE